MDTHYGHWLRILHWCTDQSMTAALGEMELTAAQGHLMAFLSHREEPPCARDIEREFRLSHPTVSGLLSRLEKKGFIEVFADESDRRCKRVRLLSKGWQCIDTMRGVIAANEERLVKGFSEEERDEFARLLRRAMENMGGGRRCHNHKKERKEDAR